MASLSCVATLVALIAAQEPAAISTSTLASLADGAAAARARYLEGDFRGAISQADKANALFEGQPSVRCKGSSYICREGLAYTTTQPAWDAWADAQATKALALYRLGNDSGADDVVRAVVTVLPAWSPDRGFVPPKQLARFDELRQQLLAGATVAVRLTDPGGASPPSLDGRAALTSATIDVVPGTHYVGADGYGHVVTISQGGPVVVPRLRSATSVSPPVATTTPKRPVIEEPPDDANPVIDDDPTWLIVGGVAGGAAIVAAVVVGVLVALSSEQVQNPGGTTVFIDASLLRE